MSNDTVLRDHLLHLLRGGDAHIHFDQLLADFPVAAINQKVEGLPYTAWQVLEHMRIAQWDILEFARNPNYASPEFPQGYWPSAQADVKDWNRTVHSFQSNLEEMANIVADPAIDLYARIPHGDGQTMLRQALLIADHNAYHLGALAVIKRLLTRERY
jgi:hypothetical protein